VQPTVTLAVHVTFTVDWAAGASGASNGGSGPVDIWLKSTQNAMGTGDNMFTGAAQSCGTSLPDLTLTAVGTATVCPPGAPSTCPMNNGKVQIQFPDSTWAAITRTFPTSGSQTGWNPGSTLTEDPSLGLLGLASSTTYGSISSPGAWPAYCANNCTGATCSGGTCSGGNAGTFTTGVTDDDMDGNPGITAIPLTTTGYTAPPTSVAIAAVPPLADKVYIVSRNEIAISGMRMTDCTHGTGTATVSLFDNHVVGCHATAGTITGTGNVSAGPCTSNMVSFIDQNRTVYTPHGSTSAASSSNPIMGTAKVTEIPSTMTCAQIKATY
jgi:hypothetical protein